MLLYGNKVYLVRQLKYIYSNIYIDIWRNWTEILVEAYLWGLYEIIFSGFGYADVENEVKCTPHTVMKIASISKPITSVLLAKLWEMEVVDIDRDISDYVKYWPQKYWMGEKVSMWVKFSER